MARSTPHVIDEAAQIALLAAPARLEIIDALEAAAVPLSVAELAQALGRAADGLYYHLRPLVEAGLVIEHPGAGMLRYRTAAQPGARLRVRYHPGDTDNARAVAGAVGSLLRVAERDFRRALADPASAVEGPRRELWAARATGWVSTTDLAEINRLLARLGELLHRSRGEPGGRHVALAWVLAPLATQPTRRRARKRRTHVREGGE